MLVVFNIHSVCFTIGCSPHPNRDPPVPLLIDSNQGVYVDCRIWMRRSSQPPPAPTHLDEPVIGMFRRVADALLAVGSTFTVWYRWDVKDTQTKILVAPGFTTTVIHDAKGNIIQRSEEGDLSE